MSNRPKVFVVMSSVEGEIVINGAFSIREDAQYFIDNVYSDNDLNLTWIDELYLDNYKSIAGLDFVYEVRAHIYDDGNGSDEIYWTNSFIGHSMDLSDRRGLVFSTCLGEYQVIVKAPNRVRALELGEMFINKSIKEGNFIKLA